MMQGGSRSSSAKMKDLLGGITNGQIPALLLAQRGSGSNEGEEMRIIFSCCSRGGWSLWIRKCCGNGVTKKHLIVLIALLAFGFGVPNGRAADSTETLPAGGPDTPKGNEASEKSSEKAVKKDARLTEIVVTATRSEKSISESPAAVSVIKREDLDSRNIQTVDSALNMVEGVFDKRAKGLDTTSRVTLRGMPEQKRTLILLDGQPLNDGYTGIVNWNAILPDNVERIEVARGPFSSLYGGNAMGGVVNLMTRMPEKREIVLKSGYGSDDYWTTYGSYGDRVYDRLSIFAGFGYSSGAGFPTDLLVRPYTASGAGTPVSGAIPSSDPQGNASFIVGDKGNNGWWRDSGTLKMAYDIDGDSKATFSFMRSEYEYTYGDPHSYLRDALGNTVWSGTLNNGGNRFTLNEYNFLNSGGGRTDSIYHLGYDTRIFNDALLKVSCGLVDVESNWYVTPGSTNATTRAGGPGKLNETPSQTFQSEMQVSVPVLEKHVLTTGVSFRYDHANTQEHDLADWQSKRSTGNLTYESGGKDNIFSAYTQAEIAIWKNIKAYLGVRGDYWEAYDGMVNQVGAAGYPQEFDSKNAFALSPKAALVFTPFESTTFRGSVGKSFRPPNVYELYRTWVSGTITYASNPNLDPETCISWDLGVEQKLGDKAVLRMTYFDNTLKDLIYRQDVTATLKQVVNVGKAATRGLEFGYEHEVADWVKLFGSYTYTDSKMLDNPAKPSTVGKRLTGVPENMFNIGGEFTLGPVSLTATGRYVDKQYNSDDNTDTAKGVPGVYDSFFVADLNIRYRIKPWATLIFSVDNVFDENYFSYYQSPGRKFFGGVTMKF